MIYQIDENTDINKPSFKVCVPQKMYPNSLPMPVQIAEVYTIETLAEVIHTPEELLATFIGNGIRYSAVTSSHERLKWPQEIIDTKFGNCFDISIFAHKFFALNNINHAIGFTVFIDEIKGYSKQAGHAFPVYQTDDGLYHIWNYFTDGAGDINGYFSSYQEAVDKAGRYFDVLYKSEYSFPGNPNNHLPRTAISTFLEHPKDLEFVDKVMDKKENNTMTQIGFIEKSNKLISLLIEANKLRQTMHHNYSRTNSKDIGIEFMHLPKNKNILTRFLHNFNSAMKYI